MHGKVVLKHVGITHIAVDKKPVLVDFINQCDSSFYFFGISAKRTSSTPELHKKLSEIGRRQGDIRFLLFNPESPELKRKAQDENENWESWKNDIYGTIKRLKSLATRDEIKIQVRLYDQFPIWRMYILDNKRIYLHYFLSEKQGPQSPLLILESNEEALFWPFYLEFIELWDRSKEA